MTKCEHRQNYRYTHAMTLNIFLLLIKRSETWFLSNNRVYLYAIWILIISMCELLRRLCHASLIVANLKKLQIFTIEPEYKDHSVDWQKSAYSEKFHMLFYWFWLSSMQDIFTTKETNLIENTKEKTNKPLYWIFVNMNFVLFLSD